jgi:hypothetical protein
MKMLRHVVVALPLLAIAGAAMADDSFTGGYLLTLKNVSGAGTRGRTSCINLTDDGSLGWWRHSGEVAFGGEANSGWFFIAGDRLTAQVADAAGNLYALSWALAGDTALQGELMATASGQVVLTANFRITSPCS